MEATIQKPWAEMTTEERTVYLAPHVGEWIRYANKLNVLKGRELYGEAYPIPWETRRFVDFTLETQKPGVLVEVPMYKFFGIPLDKSSIAFDRLYGVEVVDAPVHEKPALAPLQTESLTCPHCGAALRIEVAVSANAVPQEEDIGPEQPAEEEAIPS